MPTQPVSSLANVPKVATDQPLKDWLTLLLADVAALRALFSGMLSGSATWDAASIADGDSEDKDITVTGAALGDFVLVAFSIDITGLVLTAVVTATNTVTATLTNSTGGAVDLTSATVTVRVLKASAFTAPAALQATV